MSEINYTNEDLLGYLENLGPTENSDLETLNDFAEQQLLDSELIKQSMPDARERRKLSSASRMAGELGAVAGAYGLAGDVASRGIRQPTATFSV